MEPHQIDFKKLRSQISLQYGIELDETTLAILFILSAELKQQHTQMNKHLEEMAAQIQLSKKALQVDTQHPRWQAFWHGMGQWGLGLCLAVVSILAVISLDWNKERKEKEQLQSQLEWYKEKYGAAQKEIPKTGTDSKKNPKSKNK